MARKQSTAKVTHMALEVCGDTTEACIEVRDNMLDVLQAELGPIEVTRKNWAESPHGLVQLRCQIDPITRKPSKGKGKKNG